MVDEMGLLNCGYGNKDSLAEHVCALKFIIGLLNWWCGYSGTGENEGFILGISSGKWIIEE